jgi:hypothetical protein
VIFFFSIASRPLLESTEPPIQWLPGAVSSGVKRQGPEADHSLQSSADVKNSGAIPLFFHTSLRRDAYILN